MGSAGEHWSRLDDGVAVVGIALHSESGPQLAAPGAEVGAGMGAMVVTSVCAEVGREKAASEIDGRLASEIGRTPCFRNWGPCFGN